MPLRIGITGGIGSGKTTVAKTFEVLGIPVYYADDAAKKIMNEDMTLRAAIVQHFGEEAYKDGILNRSFLSTQVFSNKEKLELLNSLIHPATINDAAKWMEQQSTPYAIKEAALIFESISQQYLDYVIGVYAPASLRIHRAMKRDNLMREQVIERMNKQIDEDIKMRLCDFIIVNDEQQAIIPQVLELHKKLLQLAN